ncbi:hypothetical protein J6590_081228 [Homalodisca vitripennis]|nr:hypothetical protein J6590_081228 [Homalodisca vitripennis]
MTNELTISIARLVWQSQGPPIPRSLLRNALRIRSMQVKYESRTKPHQRSRIDVMLTNCQDAASDVGSLSPSLLLKHGSKAGIPCSLASLHFGQVMYGEAVVYRIVVVVRV